MTNFAFNDIELCPTGAPIFELRPYIFYNHLASIPSSKVRGYFFVFTVGREIEYVI